MSKFAVVLSKSISGDVYIIGKEDVKKWTAMGYYVLGGYTDTEKAAEELAESLCQ